MLNLTQEVSITLLDSSITSPVITTNIAIKCLYEIVSPRKTYPDIKINTGKVEKSKANNCKIETCKANQCEVNDFKAT